MQAPITLACMLMPDGSVMVAEFVGSTDVDGIAGDVCIEVGEVLGSGLGAGLLGYVVEYCGVAGDDERTAVTGGDERRAVWCADGLLFADGGFVACEEDGLVI
jgi:hypothetical protein